MKINNELFSLRESTPNKFWGEFASILLEEYKSEDFKNSLAELFVLALDDFRKKKESGDRMPYNIGYLIDKEELEFRYFVQMTAQDESQRDYEPMPLISAVRHFPNESYYVFNIHDDGFGHNEIDVFNPHLIDQYARRAYRLDGDIELPNTWHYNKQPAEGEVFKKKEFDNLLKFVGKFFARNKINRLGQGKEAYSIEEQKENKSKDWVYCLWIDGLTYCKSFNPSNSEYTHVLLHKTFVPYAKDDSVKDDTCIGEDQRKAIAPKLLKLLKDAQSYFPNQYYNTGIVCLQNILEMYVTMSNK